MDKRDQPREVGLVFLFIKMMGNCIENNPWNRNGDFRNIPKIAMIASGLTGIDFLVFRNTCCLSQPIRVFRNIRSRFHGYRMVCEFAQFETGAINYAVCFLGDLRSKHAHGLETGAIRDSNKNIFPLICETFNLIPS